MFYEWRHAEQMSAGRQGQKVNVGKSRVPLHGKGQTCWYMH